MQRLAALLIALTMLFATALPAGAQDTAEDLYEQGMRQYEAGQYVEALEHFNRVDPVQLPAEKRVRMFDAMKDADIRRNGPVDATSLLRQAEQAQRQGQAARAEALYQQVSASQDATAEQRATAQARLREIERDRQPQVTQMRRLLDDAGADLRTGRLAQAEQKLGAVQASGVDLGWFDNQLLERQLAVLAERRAAMQTAERSSPVIVDPVVTQEPRTGQPASETPAATQARPEIAPVAMQPAQPTAEDRLQDHLRLYAQEQVAEGQAAETEGNYRLAQRFFEKAAQLDPANVQAQDGLQRVRGQAALGVAPAGPLEADLNILQLRREQAISEFNERMATAQRLREAGNHEQALNAVNQAKTTLDNNRSVLAAQYAELRGRANQLDLEIDRQRQQADAASRQLLEEQQRREAAERQSAAIGERERTKQEMMRRARELQTEQKYEQALAVINQVLFLDPNDPAAQMIRDMIEQNYYAVTDKRLIEDGRRSEMLLSLQNREALTFPTEIIEYPAEWPAITLRRAHIGEMADSEANRQVTRLLQEPITANWAGAPLEEVFDELKERTGVNIVPFWQSMERAGVDPGVPVNFRQPQPMPAEQVLRLVLRQVTPDLVYNPLEYTISDGIVTISTREDAQGNKYVQVYDVKDLVTPQRRREDLDRDLDFLRDEFGVEGGVTSGIEGLGGGTGGTSTSTSTRTDSSSRSERSREGGGSGEEGGGIDAAAADFLNLIRGTIGEYFEWEETDLVYNRGTLVIKTTRENHLAINELLRQLRDTQSIQVAIEARYLLVDQNYLEEVGADIDITIDNLGSNFGPLVIEQNSFGVAAAPTTGLPGGFSTGSNSLDIGLSYVDDLQVQLLVRASQKHRRSVTLQAPHVTVMNGEPALFDVTREFAYVAAFTSQNLTGGGGGATTTSGSAVPVPGSASEGIQLQVTPQVTADRRYVGLVIQSHLSALTRPFRRFTFSSPPTIIVTDGISQTIPGVENFIELPEVETTFINTIVSVPDRGTLLMGGQRLFGEIEIEAGIPILSKIPLLNRLTTNRSRVKDERTLLILVKPIIIIPDEQEEDRWPGITTNPLEYDVTRRVSY